MSFGDGNGGHPDRAARKRCSLFFTRRVPVGSLNLSVQFLSNSVIMLESQTPPKAHVQ